LTIALRLTSPDLRAMLSISKLRTRKRSRKESYYINVLAASCFHRTKHRIPCLCGIRGTWAQGISAQRIPARGFARLGRSAKEHRCTQDAALPRRQCAPEYAYGPNESSAPRVLYHTSRAWVIKSGDMRPDCCLCGRARQCTDASENSRDTSISLSTFWLHLAWDSHG